MTDADPLFWEDETIFPRTRSGRLRPSLAYRKRRARWLTGAAASLTLAASLVTSAVMPAHSFRPSVGAAPAPAHAVLASSTESAGNRILDRAETKAGHLYSWGGTGPAYFDCSGLVWWAATSIGERGWPRDTLGIAYAWHHSSRFTLTTHPQRGDLALWGSYSYPYHVAIVTIWHNTNFEAQTYGWAGRVTWHDDTWFRPSYYLHVNW